MGRKISFTLSATRLTFRNRSGGSFSIPVRTEPTAADETMNAHDEPQRRMSFAEWCDAVEDWKRKDAATAERVVRCGSCGVPMPEPPHPDGDGICVFDTCESCLKNRRQRDAPKSEH